MTRPGVLIEHHQNVTYLNFLTDAPPPAPVRTDPLQPSSPRAAAAGPIPARWSPRPCRVVGRRFARSQLAADFLDYGWLLGLFLGALLGVYLIDHLHAIAPISTGGTP